VLRITKFLARAYKLYNIFWTESYKLSCNGKILVVHDISTVLIQVPPSNVIVTVDLYSA